MTFLKYFGYTVGAAIGSALLGGLFGAAVSMVSPEFVASTFTPPAGASVVRYASALGMIWGLFLGVGVMLASLTIAAVNHLSRSLRREKRDGEA